MLIPGAGLWDGLLPADPSDLPAARPDTHGHGLTLQPGWAHLCPRQPLLAPASPTPPLEHRGVHGPASHGPPHPPLSSAPPTTFWTRRSHSRPRSCKLPGPCPPPPPCPALKAPKASSPGPAPLKRPPSSHTDLSLGSAPAGTLPSRPFTSRQRSPQKKKSKQE